MKIDKKSPEKELLHNNNPERILSQLRALLETLEDVLKKQIALAEKEKSAISLEEDIKLAYYSELEIAYTKEAEAYGQVILTFDQLNTECNNNSDTEVNNLKSRIALLQNKLLLLNTENKEALQKKMGSIKKELELLSTKKRKKTSPFKKIGNPSYIDINA